MFVCLCKGVTDTQIQKAIQNGASTLKDVRSELGVATQCCKCVPQAQSVIQQALQAKRLEAPEARPTLFYPANTHSA